MPDERPATPSVVISDRGRISIHSNNDIIGARQTGRVLATQAGFTPGDSTLIATAISELARNILRYAQRGEITLRLVNVAGRAGIEIVAGDEGPGIADIAQAMQDGFSTSGGLGIGLPGVRRLMDEFEIVSEAGRGTTVVARKWKR